MSFSIGLKHTNNTITWLYDFILQERMFHEITEFFTFYMRQKFAETVPLTVWTIRKVYNDFNWLFGSVSTVIINPDFYSYELDESLLSIPVESGTLFFSCKIGDTFGHVTMKSHEDNAYLEDMFRRGNVMTHDGFPEDISMDRVNSACPF